MLFLSTLGPFQKNVIMVASVVLIVLLAIIGYLLSKSTSGDTWPPTISKCPDYWQDTSGEGKNCLNVEKLGNCGGDIAPGFDMRAFSKPEALCSSKTAITNCNLTWSGITNADVCSDAYKKRAAANA